MENRPIVFSIMRSLMSVGFEIKKPRYLVFGKSDVNNNPDNNNVGSAWEPVFGSEKEEKI